MAKPRIHIRTIMILIALTAFSMAAVTQFDFRRWWNIDFEPWWWEFQRWTLPCLVMVAVGTSIALTVPILGLLVIPRHKRSLWLRCVLPLAIIAIVVWTRCMESRSDRFILRAMEHYKLSDEPGADLLRGDRKAFYARMKSVHAQPPPVQAWHGIMCRRYTFKARYPWLPIGSDPPKPE